MLPAARTLTDPQDLLPINRKAYGTVLQQLVKLIRSILLWAPACLLLPEYWNKHENIIEGCLHEQEPHLRACFESLWKRNLSLQKCLTWQDQLRSNSRQHLIAALDGLSGDCTLGDVAVACLRCAENNDVLVATCLEWASTVYRQGIFRVFAAVRLLRLWNKHGVELQRPIFGFLTARSNSKGLQKNNVYKLFAELVCSKHISVGRYLQWLIARGTLRSQPQPDRVSVVLLSRKR